MFTRLHFGTVGRFQIVATAGGRRSASDHQFE